MYFTHFLFFIFYEIYLYSYKSIFYIKFVINNMTNEYYAEVSIDEEIYCKSVNNSNSSDFKIITTNLNGRNKITGFKFKFQYNDKIDMDYNSDYFFLHRYVLHYLDFLTSITSYPIHKNQFTTSIFSPSGERLITINLSKLIPLKDNADIDIDLSKYQKTLSNLDTEKIEYFRYYYAGIVFFENRLYEFSIREFFKIIENNNSIPKYKEYKTIRNLFSHHPYNLSIASKYFRNSDLKMKYKYDIIKDKENNEIVIIDRYHPNNVLELIRMTKELKSIIEPLVLN